MTRGAVVHLSLMLALAACSNGGTGSSDDGLTVEEEQAAVAKLERGYAASSWAYGEGPAELHCLAEGMVTDFGIEKLQKYGWVDANLKFDQEPI